LQQSSYLHKLSITFLIFLSGKNLLSTFVTDTHSRNPMIKKSPRRRCFQLHYFIICILIFLKVNQGYTQDNLSLNKLGYFETPGLNVFVFSDEYAEGHQGGIQIIQHGVRIATNGDIWLEPTPGQWSPFSQVEDKKADWNNQSIITSLCYPNKKAAERSFNPITYPDLLLNYSVEVKAEGKAFRILVNLDKPLPDEWVGKVGFNLELYPGDLFGKSFLMDGKAGAFPLQLTGPFSELPDNALQVDPLATGNELIVAPETELQLLTIRSEKNPVQLIDGRALHNNGWFIVRSLIPKKTTKAAIEWLVIPNIVNAWKYGPVIHINQVGYQSDQSKIALIECDQRDSIALNAELIQVLPSGEHRKVFSDIPKHWGKFHRYRYFQFDFSTITAAGIYYISYNTQKSSLFRVGTDIYERGIWQPTLEYFLPIQMCHMRVNDRYRIWHGACHMDDATMAPLNHVHFDGYKQGASTLTSWQPSDHVPGLNSGGWHDAGDFDLRVESQAGTVYSLCLIYEEFGLDYDVTTIDQSSHLVEMHLPDNKPDILQQIEHGLISIIGGYQNLGRLYRGIICRGLRQYVTLGDPASITDNIVFKADLSTASEKFHQQKNDDRWVFTEENPRHELQVCTALAAAARVMKGYNDTLAELSLKIAVELWNKNKESEFIPQKIEALTELILTSNDPAYIEQLISWQDELVKSLPEIGWTLGRIQHLVDKNTFQRSFMLGMQQYYMKLQQEIQQNPFGVVYHPVTWGVAWNVERFGVAQYYLYKNLKNGESKKYMLAALDYLLGVHPGEAEVSFVSGVGSKSATVAYGLNRDDWSYIPGGVVSGTATIKPDLPEFKEWPYLWQQSEYMISGAAEYFMFLVLGAREVL